MNGSSSTALRAASKNLRIETAPVFRPLLHPSRYKAAFGGRGSGKSHYFAELLIERALLKPGLRAVCIRQIQHTLAQSSKRLIEDKIIALGVGKYFDVMKPEITTPDNGLIIFQGMQNHTSESIKSLEGYDIAWVDEAQMLSSTSLDLLRPTIRKKGSELWFSWNPKKPDDPVDSFFRGDKKPPPDSVIVEANWNDNPWFQRTTLQAEMEYDRARDPDRYAHVWMGKHQTFAQARVFRNWTVEAFETPGNARFFFGADWGFAVDPTVLVRCYIDGRKLFVDYEAYAIGCDVDHVPFLFAGTEDATLNAVNGAGLASLPANNQTAWKGIPGARRWPLIADSSNPQSISYMQRHGFQNIKASVKGPGSVEEGVEFLKGHDIIVHPRCEHVIRELTLYSYEVDPRTNEVLPRLSDKKNHTIDSLRYAVESLRRSNKVSVGFVKGLY